MQSARAQPLLARNTPVLLSRDEPFDNCRWVLLLDGVLGSLGKGHAGYSAHKASIYSSCPGVRAVLPLYTLPRLRYLRFTFESQAGDGDIEVGTDPGQAIGLFYRYLGVLDMGERDENEEHERVQEKRSGMEK